MTLAVIGSGFGRTGTASLKRALGILAFGPCHHMEDVFGDPAQVIQWRAFVEGEQVDWGEVFNGYRSQVDWPGALAWRELASAYPDAKIIHSVRPDDAWWASFSSTIGKLLTNYQTLSLPGHVTAMLDVMHEALEDTFRCPLTDREGILAAYRRRTEEVRAHIPRERLLVFDVAEGWEPLCAFLKVPIPQEPFPRTNSTREFWVKFGGVP